MSKVCHECGEYVPNPYYNISLIVGDANRENIVISNLDLALCDRDYQKIPQGSKQVRLNEVKGRVLFAVEIAMGAESMWGTVSRCGPVSHSNGYEFIEGEAVKKHLSATYKRLINGHNEEWVRFNQDHTLGNQMVERPDKDKTVEDLLIG